MGAAIGPNPCVGFAIGNKSLTGLAVGDRVVWTTTATPPPTGPVNLFGSVVPNNPADADAAEVELGMRFTVAATGKAMGVRFYKGTGNSGTHTGYLYAGSARVATAGFTNETGTGWQQALFPTPVDLTPGTTYTVTYIAPVGRYAGDGNYPWPKTANGITGLGGVYRYGVGTTAPTGSFNNSNYYVDIVAQLAAIPPDPPVEPPVAGSPSPAYWEQWDNGPSTADTWFPIGAWNADVNLKPAAAPYADLGDGLRTAGINTIVGTWDWLSGTDPRGYIERIRALGMKTFASGPDMTFMRQYPDYADTVIGWQIGDEYDMARVNDPAPGGPSSPTRIHEKYLAAKAQDPTRPLHINWGKAVGGRNGKYFWYPAVGGFDTGSADGDLKLYLESADANSVDYYWWTDPWESKPNACRYGEAIDSMRRYAAMSNSRKPLWGFVETTRGERLNMTADWIESAVWSMIVHGARGILYFLHDFGPNPTGGFGLWAPNYFDRAGADAKIARMKQINTRIMGLAPVLNSPETGTLDQGGRERPGAELSVSSTNSIPVDVMVRRHGGKTYVFAQASGDDTHLLSGNTSATFTLPGSGSGATTVRDEGRTVTRTNGVWSDTFTPYQMHIYVL